MYAYARFNIADRSDLLKAILDFLVNTVGYELVYHTDPNKNLDFANRVVTRTNQAIVPGKVMLNTDPYSINSMQAYQFGSSFNLTTLPTSWDWNWNKAYAVNSNYHASVFLNSFGLRTRGESGLQAPCVVHCTKTTTGNTVKLSTSLGMSAVYPLSAAVFPYYGLSGSYNSMYLDTNQLVEVYASKNFIFIGNRANYTGMDQCQFFFLPPDNGPGYNCQQTINPIVSGSNVAISVPSPYLFTPGKYYFIAAENGSYVERFLVVSRSPSGIVASSIRSASFSAGSWVGHHFGKGCCHICYNGDTSDRFPCPIPHPSFDMLGDGSIISPANQFSGCLNTSSSPLVSGVNYGDYFTPSYNGENVVAPVALVNNSSPGTLYGFLGPDDIGYCDSVAARDVIAISERYYATVGAATLSTLTDNNASWVVNSFAGKFVSIASGAGINQVRKIASNTDKTLTLVNPFDVVPAVADAYSIADTVYRNLTGCGGARQAIVCREVY